MLLTAMRDGVNLTTWSTDAVAYGESLQVTLEIQAELPQGAPKNVVRTVTENARTLKFQSQGL